VSERNIYSRHHINAMTAQIGQRTATDRVVTECEADDLGAYQAVAQTLSATQQTV